MPVRLKTSVVSIALLVLLAVYVLSQTPPTANTESDKTESTKNAGEEIKLGGGVSAPRVLFSPEPEYSKVARKAKYQGVCVLSLIVGADGKPRDVQVTRTLGMGLDEKAIEAVKKWKFDPAKKDGQPVAAKIHIEVNFRLY